jgi:hypothetical protein
MALTPQQSEFARRYLAGEQPPLDLLEEPGFQDPSAGLPPEATAGPSFGLEITHSPVANPSAPPLGTEDAIKQAMAQQTKAPPVVETQPIIGQPGEVALPPSPKALALTGPDPMLEVRRQQQAAAAQIPVIAPPTARPRMGTGGGALAQPPWLKETVEGAKLRGEPLGLPAGVPKREFEELGIEQRNIAERGEEGLQAQFERGRQEAAAQASAAALMAGQQAELARKEAERQHHLEAMEHSQRDLLDKATAQPIDSERYWNNLSTGEQIVKSIAVALGAYGAAITGAPNVAYDRLSKSIENDISAQRANKAAKFQRAEAEGSLAAMARARFSDERVQDLAMREAAFNMVGAELEKWSTLAKTPEQESAIAQMHAQNTDQLNRLRQQRRQAMEVVALQALAPKASVSATKKAQEAEANPLYVPGLGFARKVDEAERMRTGLANYNESKRMFRRAHEMADSWSAKFGSTWLEQGTSEFHTADALSKNLQSKVARSFGGVITDSDREEAARQVPNMTKWGGGLHERLNMAEQALDNNYRAAIEATIIGAPIAPVPSVPGATGTNPLPQGRAEAPTGTALRGGGSGSSGTGGGGRR